MLPSLAGVFQHAAFVKGLSCWQGEIRGAASIAFKERDADGQTDMACLSGNPFTVGFRS